MNDLPPVGTLMFCYSNKIAYKIKEYKGGEFLIDWMNGNEDEDSWHHLTAMDKDVILTDLMKALL